MTQERLIEFLASLPIELQTHIGRYNVHHRPAIRKVLHQLQMRNVFQQYFRTGKYESKYCSGCWSSLKNTEKYVGLYVYPWRKNEFIYCDEYCAEINDTSILKARRRWLNKL